MNWYRTAQVLETDEDIEDFLHKILGLGKYKPETKYEECPECGKKQASWREEHPDTDMNEMVLHCPDCGDVG